jgi:hypothetical protein
MQLSLKTQEPPMSQAPMNYAPMTPAKSTGLAVTSLVLGIISLFVCLSWAAAACGVLAIVFGAIALNKVKAGTGGGHGMAKAGLIMGCVGLALDVIFIILVLTIGLTFFKGVQKQMQQQQQQQTAPPGTPTPAPAPTTPGSSTQSFHVGFGERFEFRGVSISC